MLIKTKYSCKKQRTTALWQKTRRFTKITGFTAFDENHGFRDFLLSLVK